MIFAVLKFQFASNTHVLNCNTWRHNDNDVTDWRNWQLDECIHYLQVGQMSDARGVNGALG